MNPGHPPLDPRAVAIRLASDWGLESVELSSLGGGMNSLTWLVRSDGARFVAKAVPLGRWRTFEAGLAVASIVEESGVPAGAPLPTRTGTAVVELGGWALALLRHVGGTPLTGGPVAERVLIGATLGRAHRALLGRNLANASTFPWLDPAEPSLTVRSWVRPAIEAALATWRAIPPESLTWAPLHTDPAPEAFLLGGESGTCGLIDWDLGVVGPLLYDLASAEMYVGGPARSQPLIEAYVATGALASDEIERGLRPLAQLRWAVQADYFARRIATDDLTGIADRSENDRGLEDARRALLG